MCVVGSGGGERSPTSTLAPGKKRETQGGGESGAAVMAGRDAAHLAAGASRRGSEESSRARPEKGACWAAGAGSACQQDDAAEGRRGEMPALFRRQSARYSPAAPR